jgi:hypothetical protein
MAVTKAQRVASIKACPIVNVGLDVRSFDGNEGVSGHCKRRRGDSELDRKREGEIGLFIVALRIEFYQSMCELR